MKQQYNLKTFSNVKIEICNLNGQTIAMLNNSPQSSGKQNFILNISQYKLETGVYFCRLTVSNKNDNYTTAARFQVIK